jgi:muramoyltetrapeptide carboxypeptidase
LLERCGYLAGDDARRLTELNEALCDPRARAIVAVRGGYGSTRICHDARFDALLEHPKWCVGFSDFTALHLEAARAGVASLHAPNLTALGRGDALARDAWVDALERPLARRCYSGLLALAPGAASGILVGGNLTLLFTAAASGRLSLPDGCLLFFEEVHEAPYRIDRMLTALRASGKLANVAGFCVGDLTGDDARDTQRRCEEVVHDCLGPLGVPILAGLPVGHGLVNQPLPLGVRAHASAARGLILNPDATDTSVS